MNLQQRKKSISIIADYSIKGIAQVLSAHEVDGLVGLSSLEATTRLDQFGANNFSGNSTTVWTIIFRQFHSPFVYMLIVATVLAAILGEYIDAAFILLFITINAGIGFYQEYHTDRSLALLNNYITPHARVLRDGQCEKVPVTALVPGDIVLVQAGDIIPADCRAIETAGLIIDESILTGESASVGKTASTLSKKTNEVHEAKNILFAGTTVTAGSGQGVVIATGNHSVAGSIAYLTATTKKESEFAKGIQAFSMVILRLVGATLALIFLVNILIKDGGVNIGELAVFSIALAVSIVPEALPLVTTLSLARGALKMAKKHVVVRRLSAIEDLGGIKILCTDKTGTLTENKLTIVDQLQITPRQFPVAFGFLARPYNDKGKNGDPFDNAFEEKITNSERVKLSHYEYVSQIPFDPTRKRNSVLLKHQGQYVLITRGAPEEVLSLCRNSRQVAQEVWRKEQGLKGRRVLAVAARSFIKKPNGALTTLECDMHLVGYVSFEDPIKPTTISAINHAKALGVTIKIITGDSPDVAGAVAAAVGLIKSPQDVMTGSKLMSLSVSEQKKALEKYSVFARISPEEKFTIISLLQEQSPVGFLGEGINDAPALKAAGVSLVVPSAADVAREAADIVILQKSLAVVVDGIKEGRHVFINTVKYIRATLASNLGNFYAVAVSSLFIPFLPMLPVQILLLNLFTDFPMIAIAADTVETEEVQKPQQYHPRELVGIALLLGAVSTVFDFIVFALFFQSEPQVLQTSWFMASVLTELVLLFSIRTRRSAFKAPLPPASIIIITGVVATAAVVLPFLPIGQSLLHFARPQAIHLMIIGGLVVSYFLATESVKLVYYRHIKHLNGK